MDLPLLEDDLSSPGVIEPDATTHGVRVDAMPDTAVLCFFPEVIERLAADGARRVCTFTLESGRTAVVETEVDGRLLAVLQPGVGAPLSTILMEDLIALGSAGSSRSAGPARCCPSWCWGTPIVVDSAVRDEGTSYHYLAPAAVVDADPAGVATLSATLDAAGVPYLRARTWTTDAIYRETRSRVDRRRAEGCAVVEMEARPSSRWRATAASRSLSCCWPPTPSRARRGSTGDGPPPPRPGRACSSWPRRRPQGCDLERSKS